MSAGFAAVATPYVRGTPLDRTVEIAVIGGTASVLGGGKFANGAVTAAFVYLSTTQGGQNGAESSQRGAGNELVGSDGWINQQVLVAGRSPTVKCVVPGCGAPHGGLFGPYCPNCYQKSLEQNSGIPPLWEPPPAPLKPS